LDAFSAISWSASLFFSINWLKLPQREYSGGICVRLIQPPLDYMKKSYDGLTEVSMFAVSNGGAFLLSGVGVVVWS